MKIKTKLKVNTLVSAGVVLIVGITLLWASQQVKDSISKNKTAGQLVEGIFGLNILTNDYLLHREKRARRQWQLKHYSLTQLIADEQLQKTGEPHILKKIQQYHESLKKIFSQLTTSYESRSENSQQAKALIELEEQLISQLLLKSQTMVSSAHQLAHSSLNEVVKAQQNSGWIVIFLVIIIVTLVVTSSWALGRSVMNPHCEAERRRDHGRLRQSGLPNRHHSKR